MNLNGDLSLSELNACFKTLRFKTLDESDDREGEEEEYDTEEFSLADDEESDPNDNCEELEDSDEAEDSNSIDFDIGEVSLLDGSEQLGTIELPPGTYRRLDIDFHSEECGYSVSLANVNGSFSTDEPYQN